MTKSVTLPKGYLTAASDVPWKASYLALEPPSAVHMLAEFGAGPDTEALSPVAVTEPFRILSDEGVEHALEIARDLEAQAVEDGRSKRLRGATYRSEFYAGMYADERLVSFLSELAQADLRPHPIGHHRVQFNFAPEQLERDVDVWHHDVVSYDFVMLITDPAEMRGGHTEYFQGTLEEGWELLRREGAIPADRIARVGYPGAGWAFLQQGHRVLHRAARLEQPYPRISLVASYYCSDPQSREPTVLSPLRKADGRQVALVEWSTYAAYRTMERLQRFLDSQPDFSVPVDEVRKDFEACLVDARTALAEFDSDDEGHIIGLD